MDNGRDVHRVTFRHFSGPSRSSVPDKLDQKTEGQEFLFLFVLISNHQMSRMEINRVSIKSEAE